VDRRSPTLEIFYVLKDVAIVVLKRYGSMCCGIDHQIWALPLASQLPMAKNFDLRVEQKNLVPRMKLFLLDSLIMPSFGSFLVDSGIVIRFLSLFSFCSSLLST